MRVSDTTHTKRRRRAIRETGGFSLVEAIAAIAILVILTYLLLRFFTGVQDVYGYSMNAVSLQDSARVALEIISQDVRSTVARPDDIPGSDIRFHQPDSASIWIVCSGEPSTGATSEMLEVAYRHNARQLERAFVDDSNSAWNIYGDRDNADDQDGFQPVIEGVFAQTFICYDRSMTPYQPDNESTPPYMVSIILTLMDPHSYERWQSVGAAQRNALERQTLQTFRKSVRVGSGEL